MPKSKKRRPGKPQGMNLAQTVSLERQVRDKTIHAEAWALFNHWSGALLQMAHDAHTFAAEDTLGLGEAEYPAYQKSAWDYVHEMSDLIKEDCEDDPEMVYSRAKIDRRMEQVCGKNFEPWEVRYGQRSETQEDL